MVVAKAIGQMGNGMFQVAAALGYARKYGFEWAADVSRGHAPPYSKLHDVFPNLPKASPYGGRYHEHPHGHCSLHNMSYDLCHFNYHPIPNFGPNLILSGFFQSYKYFENSSEEIRKVFALPHWVEFEDYVSLHVRRQDYVTNAKSFPPIDMRYIQKALDCFPMDTKYIVCSDDISWTRDNLPVNYYHFEFSDRDTKQDLEIQSSCKGNIIANSTFSYWAAWLNPNPKKVVISPSHKRGFWFGRQSGIQSDCVDLLLPEWKQIEW